MRESTLTGSNVAPEAGPRIAADWLHSPALRAVFAALANSGLETRVVGGAVRNALLDLPVGDIDLATQILPNDVMRLAAAAGLGAHPTGIDHGTITVVSGGMPFEVTTLRRDVETDGRRAVVAFTHDWAEDARRRDFTINALSCDAGGRVFDPVGGLSDLRAGHVRFICDADERIREDYLRILRFFRFTALYGRGAPDASGLAACAALKPGLAQLSAERIGSEMMKLLAAPRAGAIIQEMAASGILDAVLGFSGQPEHLQRLAAIETALGEPPDPMTRAAVLAISDGHNADALALRWRLSGATRDALKAAALPHARSEPGLDPAGSEAAARGLIYRVGIENFKRATRAAWARSGEAGHDPAWRAKCLLADHWRPPQMPFSGSDVLALGVPAGPRVGVILKAFEAWWVGQNFPADPAVQHAMLRELARQT